MFPKNKQSIKTNEQPPRNWNTNQKNNTYNIREGISFANAVSGASRNPPSTISPTAAPNPIDQCQLSPLLSSLNASNQNSPNGGANPNINNNAKNSNFNENNYSEFNLITQTIMELTKNRAFIQLMSIVWNIIPKLNNCTSMHQMFFTLIEALRPIVDNESNKP